MKRYIWMILVCSLLLTLAACGEVSPEPETTGTQAADQQTQPQQTTQPQETTQPTTQPTVTTDPNQPEYIYDDKGNLIEIVDPVGGKRQVYAYDQRGNVLEDVQYIRGEEYCRTSYRYDDADRVVQEIYSEYGKECTRTTCRYDGSGKLEEKAYYENGAEVWKKTYLADGGYIEDTHPQEHEDCRQIYNGKGDLVELIFYWDDVESYRSVLTYDENGRLLEEIDYEYGVELCRSRHIYDEEGNEVRIRMEFPLAKVESSLDTTFHRVRRVYRGSKLITEYRYEQDVLTQERHYNDAEKLITEISYVDGKLSTTSHSQYDQRGNRTLLTVTDENGEEVSRTEYKYDEENRLTESTLREEQVYLNRYTYDERGNLESCVTTVQNLIWAKEEYRYTYEGDTLVQKDFLVNGKNHHTWYYDETGRVLEKVIFSGGKETGSELYHYWDHHTEIWQDTGVMGDLSNITGYDSQGVALSRCYYQNNDLLMEEYFNTDGEIVQQVYHQGATVSRVLTVYEYVQEKPESGRVTAQRITGIHFPALDNNPFSYYFEYDGAKLIREIFDGDDWMETVFDGDYDRPLYADWVDGFSDEYCQKEITYDEKGRLTQTRYLVDGAESHKTVYTYDSRDHLLERTSFWDGERGERTTWTYNAKGELTEKVSYYEDRLTSRCTYRYDDRGNRLEERIESGGTLSVYTFEYDSKGNLIAEAFAADGEEGYRHTYRYDANGVLLEKRSQTAQGIAVNTYEYDKAGRLTHIYTGDFPSCIYLYNESGKLSEYILYSDYNTDEIAHYRYCYDENGMLCEIVLQYGDHSPGSILITYDIVSATKEEAAGLEQILNMTLEWI